MKLEDIKNHKGELDIKVDEVNVPAEEMTHEQEARLLAEFVKNNASCGLVIKVSYVAAPNESESAIMDRIRTSVRKALPNVMFGKKFNAVSNNFLVECATFKLTDEQMINQKVKFDTSGHESDYPVCGKCGTENTSGDDFCHSCLG